MADLKIRNVDKDTVVALDALAAKQKISREEYLRRCIKSWTVKKIVKETEDRYANLVFIMEEIMQETNERLASIDEMLKQYEREI